MTLGEMKEKTLRLIEAIDSSDPNYTSDTDLSNKMNDVINQLQYEVARMKRISAYKTMVVTEGLDKTFIEIAPDLYQLIKIKDVAFEINGRIVTFLEAGTAKIYYFKYPTSITYETPDTYTFELDPDVLEILPYGIAADLLKSDPSEQYGTIYSKRYQELMSRLDSRQSTGMITFEGGI